MKATFLHELGSAFTGLTAYLFSAFLLLFGGIYTLAYSLNMRLANFAYVLQSLSFLYLILVPLATMRAFAEERHQKTDQLLYALPLKTWQIVGGKYLSLVTMFFVPMVIICLYPYIFSFYGEVYLPGAYGAIFAFFCMGAALIAIGMFVSSLTDNQGFAAGIAIVLFLLNYYSVTLAEQVSATALGSAFVLCVVWMLLGFVIKNVTKSMTVALGVTAGLEAVTVAAYFITPKRFEGLVPNIMKQLSLFDRFNTFVSGIFDLTGLVFYASVIALGLLLTVQSMEKRRYN